MVAPPFPCGVPARYLVKNRDPLPYAMCDHCADHNVTNRGARYVTVDELARYPTTAAADDDLAQPIDDEFDEADAVLPSNDAAKGEIAELAITAKEQEAEVIRCTAELQRALDAYTNTVEVELPQAMANVGMAEFKLTDGTQVKIVHKFIGTKLTDPNGLDYVEQVGYGYAIRTMIVVELPKEELELAREVAELLRRHPRAARFVKLEVERAVHHSTMGSIAKEMVERKLDPPLERLGVHRRTRAEVGRSRPRTVDLKGLARR